MARKITLGMVLTPAQNVVDCSGARFKVLKCGRRWGKTKYACYWLTKRALQKSGLYWYVAKSLGLIREEVWFELLTTLHNAEDELGRKIIIKADERLMTIQFEALDGRMSVIACKSAEKEDNLRGRGVRAMVVDEAAFIRGTIWGNVLRATLVDHVGPALIMSSPRKGWFTRSWNDAKLGKLEGWEAFHFTIYDNPHIEASEIESVRRTTPEDTWLQEYMAQEVDHVGVVLSEFDNNSIYTPDSKFLDYRLWPCVRGVDYGGDGGADTACVWIHIHPAGYLIASDEHSSNDGDVAKHCGVIRSKSKGLKIASNDTVIDQSTFRKEGTSGTSISKRFEENGVRCQRGDKDKDAGVDILKRGFRGDGSLPWIYISTRCPKLIAAVQEWEHGSHEPDVLAAFRYGATHAVQKKLTAIFGVIPDLKGSRFHDEVADPLKLMQEGKVLLPGWMNRKNKRTTWGWDHSMGAPC